MLRSLNEWVGKPVMAWDGPLGEVTDAWFDDLEWRLRYLVISLGDRPVLLIPQVLALAAGEEPIQVDLSREQIVASPPVPPEAVTREYEGALHDHYGWELYELEMETGADDDESWGVNPHLRSFAEVSTYPIVARDGRAGRLADLVVNEENWALFYMVIADDRLLGEEKAVILPPSWVDVIRDEEIILDLGRDVIGKSQPYDPEHLND